MSFDESSYGRLIGGAPHGPCMDDLHENGPAAILDSFKTALSWSLQGLRVHMARRAAKKHRRRWKLPRWLTRMDPMKRLEALSYIAVALSSLVYVIETLRGWL